MVSMKVLSNDMLCVFILGTVALFHLPDPQVTPLSQSHLQPSLVQPYFTSRVSYRWSSLHTSPVIPISNNARVLHVLQHGRLYTLTASTSPDECTFDRLQDMEPIPLVTHAAVGCRWAVRILPPTNRTRDGRPSGMIVETPVWADHPQAQQAAIRLTAGAESGIRNKIEVNKGLPEHSAVQEVSFDEWSGRVMIYSWDKEQCLATFIDLAG